MLPLGSIDHLASAWRDHESAVEEFEKIGLSATFGGTHADGTTQMSMLPFADGSYLELIAPTDSTEPGDTVRWPDHIQTDAGPCAWCLRAEDITGAAKAAIDAGEPIVGPQRGGRTRPDGTTIEWDELFVGPEPDRFMLPFFVRDRTPRSYRVPDAWVHEGPITGIAEIVLLAEDTGWIDRFERLFGIPTPIEHADAAPGLSLRTVPGAPISFAKPSTEGNEGSAEDESGRFVSLADRLDRYPPGPACCLFCVDSMEAAHSAYALGDSESFGDRTVAWFEGPIGDRFGVMETNEV